MEKKPQQQWYYKVAYFFVANQVVFKRLAVVLLILLNIIFWWSAGVRWVNYLSSTANYNRALVLLNQDIIDWTFYRTQHKPASLEIISVDKVKVDKDTYDFVAKVYNPNKDWHVRQVDYTFLVDDFVTEWQSDFVLPGQNKYLLQFSYFSRTTPKQIDLKIGDVNWQRVNEQEEAEIIDSILIENKQTERSNNISQVKFDVTNDSHFGWWQVGWQVVLYQGTHPIAVNYVTTQNFLSGQQRQVSAAWSSVVGTPSKIDIVFDVDIFDKENYVSSVDTSPVNLIKGAKDVRN